MSAMHWSTPHWPQYMGRRRASHLARLCDRFSRVQVLRRKRGSFPCAPASPQASHLAFLTVPPCPSRAMCTPCPYRSGPQPSAPSGPSAAATTGFSAFTGFTGFDEGDLSWAKEAEPVLDTHLGEGSAPFRCVQRHFSVV